MRPVRRTTAAAALGAVAAVGVGTGAVFAVSAFTGGHGHRAAPLATFDEQGVTVTVVVRDQGSNRATLAVTFAPDRPGFHLYSADLPPAGVDGVGRPLTVTPAGVLAAAGHPTTNVAAHLLALQGADMSVPVYPDGPVTATLPVTFTGSGAATLSVGYAACSETECLPPVTGHAIGLRVDGGSLTAASGVS